MNYHPIRCFGQKYSRHDPRPMTPIASDVYHCPACESRVEVRGLRP